MDYTELNKLSVKELRKLAGQFKIRHYGVKKAQLVEELTKLFNNKHRSKEVLNLVATSRKELDDAAVKLRIMNYRFYKMRELVEIIKERNELLQMYEFINEPIKSKSRARIPKYISPDNIDTDNMNQYSIGELRHIVNDKDMKMNWGELTKAICGKSIPHEEVDMSDAPMLTYNDLIEKCVNIGLLGLDLMTVEEIKEEYQKFLKLND